MIADPFLETLLRRKLETCRKFDAGLHDGVGIEPQLRDGAVEPTDKAYAP